MRQAEGPGPENDQFGVHRSFTTLAPGLENRTTTVCGLSAVTVAGPLARPLLAETLHSTQLLVRQTGWSPAISSERRRVASDG
jgi:hypothetical protein